MRTETSFDTSRHHIEIEFRIINRAGLPFEFSGILDTGAPWTELSDKFLHHAGLIERPVDDVSIKPDQETQKYARIQLPSITICGHTLDDFNVIVSRFDPAWGIAALIGLDFFRRFRVTIDYRNGVLVCERLSNA